MYICCNWKSFSTFERALAEADKLPKSCIVWDKKVRIQNLDKFYKRHEFILYYGEFGGQKTLDGDVWVCDREVRKDHPTAKPVELCAKAITYSSKEGDIVLDLFGGSGSTLIASESTARKCYMMELDPQYVDVIIERWENFTGKKAKLINEN
jgi:site-specific DNA-methyltransferase (adenine-specific)